VGKHDEAIRVESIMSQASVNKQLMGIVSPSNDLIQNDSLGTLAQLNEIVRVNEIDEIIYCSSDVSSHEIIKSMLSLVSQGVDFKIAPPDSLSVIGSNSIDTAGDLYTVDINAISLPSNKRFKRILDITTSTALIALSPVLVFFGNGIITMLRNSLRVLIGKRTWVGYIGKNEKGLPHINMLYAKNYSISKDIKAIWINIAQRTR
jgi:hypothetical protein